MINSLRNQLLEKIEDVFNESVRQQVETATPILSQEFSNAIKIIETKISALELAPSNFQFTSRL